MENWRSGLWAGPDSVIQMELNLKQEAWLQRNLFLYFIDTDNQSCETSNVPIHEPFYEDLQTKSFSSWTSTNY